jgi:hypothetical protein
LNLKFAKIYIIQKNVGEKYKKPEFKFVDAGFKNAPKKLKANTTKKCEKTKILKVRIYIWL